MEQEHPIPQQISAYQFRLVGDMTLNQFFQVAGGALLSLAIYSSSLPTYFKWPLMVITFLFGIAFAFFPFQDRPLATWLILFFKAIYSPTIYIWKQGSEKREFFVSENTAVSTDASDQQASAASSTAQTSQDSSTTSISTKLESGEAEFLSKVERQLETPNIIIPPPVTQTPQIPVTQTPQATVAEPTRNTVSVVITEPVKVDVAPETVKQTVEENIKPTTLDEKFVPAQTQTLSGVVSANFIPEASPPLPPNIANVIVGQVLDPNGKIIDGAILEILDPQGRPLRALKSNKLGHFMIVTPLANGTYNLVTEREGYEFDPVSIDAKGEIIGPIAIISKNASNSI